jgi:hypothetical protein
MRIHVRATRGDSVIEHPIAAVWTLRNRKAVRLRY